MQKVAYHFAQGEIKTSSYLYKAKEHVELLRFFGVLSSKNRNFEGRLNFFIQKIIHIIK